MAATVEHHMADRSAMPRRMDSPGAGVGFVAVNGHTSPAQVERLEKRVTNGQHISQGRLSPESPDSAMLPEIHVGQRSKDSRPVYSRATPMDRQLDEPAIASPAKRKRTDSPEDVSDTVSESSGGSVQEASAPKRQMQSFGPPLVGSPPVLPERTNPTRTEHQPSPGVDRPSTPHNPTQRTDEERPVTDTNALPARDEHDARSSNPAEHPTEDVDANRSPQAQNADIVGSSTQPNGVSDNTTPDGKQPRKRQFSHRTKSGCMTCRRRKKKCDEQKPDCRNCLRGGFTCEGYPAPNTYPKHHINKTPLPLQSKSGPTAFPVPRSGDERYYDGGHGQPPLDGSASRPIPVNDDHARQNRSPWPSSMSWVPPAVPGHSHDYYRSHPPPHPPPRELVDRNAPTSFQPPAQPNPPNPPPNVMPLHHGLPQRHPPDMFAARQPPFPPMRTSEPLPVSEREKMLDGKEYKPYDRELMGDRTFCQERLRGVNSNPSISDQERYGSHVAGLLRLRNWTQPGQQAHSPPQGKIGPNTVLESPFNCIYGYNLHFGSEVVVQPNCMIYDAGRVTIGDGVSIGINVTILTDIVPESPSKRRGIHSLHVAKEVVIEENAYIGANTTICPGVRIGRGAYVKEASVVTKDVPEYCTAAGNPTEVLRGIRD